MTCTPMNTSRLRANLDAVRSRIAAAAERSGRDPSEVKLVPVTKAVSPAVAAALADLGERDLAENRAAELEAKAAAVGGVRWHFIGHLQRNKARRVARLAAVIHSVDSPRLAARLARVAAEEGRRLGVYLQVDFTGEASKHGLRGDELSAALETVAGSPDLDLFGLMAMAPLAARPGHDAGTVFVRVAALARRLEHRRGDAFLDGACRLSMGMSDDLEAAVAAGSTCVRIGSALFEGVEDPREASR